MKFVEHLQKGLVRIIRLLFLIEKRGLPTYETEDAVFGACINAMGANLAKICGLKVVDAITILTTKEGEGVKLSYAYLDARKPVPEHMAQLFDFCSADWSRRDPETLAPTGPLPDEWEQRLRTRN